MITLHSIKQIRPFRMDTRLFHREIEQKKRETTEQLKRVKYGSYVREMEMKG